jgi:hypothetical protein
MRNQVLAFLTWLFVILLVVSALTVLLCSPAKSETVAQLISSVRQRSVLIDQTRFPDTTVMNFTNDELIRLTVIGQTLQKETTYVVSSTNRSYRLPVKFYLPLAAILNGNPNGKPEEAVQRIRLQYVPLALTGAVFTVKSTGRPTQFSQWGDSLLLNATSETGSDTVWLDYFAYPKRLTATTDTVQIPDAFLPLLKDRVLLTCYGRMVATPPNQSQIEKEIIDLETKLLGRPTDDR